MADLEELARRIEEATGADRGLDKILAKRFGTFETYTTQRPYGEEDYGVFGGTDFHEDFPTYTGSLDAAVALCERTAGRERLKELIEAAAEMWWSRPNFKSEEFARFLCLALVQFLIRHKDQANG